MEGNRRLWLFGITWRGRVRPTLYTRTYFATCAVLNVLTFRSLHTDGGPSMSSITFPNAGQSLTGPTSSSNDGDMGFFTGPFDGASNSSFQMNPLSSHPPRTPRTSIVSSAYEYGGDIYTPKEELIEQQAESVVSEDEDDAHASRVRKENVWHDLLKTAYGRDKTFVR